MKLLFIILLILSSNCFGQKADNLHGGNLRGEWVLHVDKHDTTVYKDTLPLTKEGYPDWSIIDPEHKLKTFKDSLPWLIACSKTQKDALARRNKGVTKLPESGHIEMVNSTIQFDEPDTARDSHYDTVKVMIFYADTLHEGGGIFINAGTTDFIGFVQYRYGYVIDELHNGWPETRFPYKKTISYLDIYKHPLPKNIIVIPQLTKEMK